MSASPPSEPLTSLEAVERLRLRHSVPETEGWKLVEQAHQEGYAPSHTYGVIVTSPEPGEYVIKFM